MTVDIINVPLWQCMLLHVFPDDQRPTDVYVEWTNDPQLRYLNACVQHMYQVNRYAFSLTPVEKNKTFHSHKSSRLPMLTKIQATTKGMKEGSKEGRRCSKVWEHARHYNTQREDPHYTHNNDTIWQASRAKHFFENSNRESTMEHTQSNTTHL